VEFEALRGLLGGPIVVFGDVCGMIIEDPLIAVWPDRLHREA